MNKFAKQCKIKKLLLQKELIILKANYELISFGDTDQIMNDNHIFNIDSELTNLMNEYQTGNFK